MYLLTQYELYTEDKFFDRILKNLSSSIKHLPLCYTFFLQISLRDPYIGESQSEAYTWTSVGCYSSS